MDASKQKGVKLTKEEGDICIAKIFEGYDEDYKEMCKDGTQFWDIKALYEAGEPSKIGKAEQENSNSKGAFDGKEKR
jgi:hypothetical protein